MAKINLLLALLFLIPLSSCLQKKPYEITSPCTAIDSNATAGNPCQWRPVNILV